MWQFALAMVLYATFVPFMLLRLFHDKPGEMLPLLQRLMLWLLGINELCMLPLYVVLIVKMPLVGIATLLTHSMCLGLVGWYVWPRYCLHKELRRLFPFKLRPRDMDIMCAADLFIRLARHYPRKTFSLERLGDKQVELKYDFWRIGQVQLINGCTDVLFFWLMAEYRRADQPLPDGQLHHVVRLTACQATRLVHAPIALEWQVAP